MRNVLLAAKGALESSVVFEPVHGPGEYLLYYLPHTTRWQTFDGRDDLQSTTYEPLAAEHDPEWFMSHVGGLDNVSRLAAATHFDSQAPCLPCISPISPLYLPCISPVSPRSLPPISRAAMALSPAAAAVRCASFSASSSALVCGRYAGDMGEICGRYRGDFGEIWGRYGAELEQALALTPSPNP